MRRLLPLILTLGLLTASCELLEEPVGQFHARFDDAGGLREGAPVYVAGVRMGRVGSVRLEEGKARVDFTMDDSGGLVVHEDACVSVGWYGGGDPHLALVPGTTDRPGLAEGSEITCVKGAGEQAEAILEKAALVLERATTGKGTVARLLNDEKLANKVEAYFEAGSAAPPPPPAASSAPAPATSARPAGPSPSVRTDAPF